MANLLYVSSTRVVWVKNLCDAVSEAEVNDATGTLDVVDSDGGAVVSDISFTAVGSGGDYYAVIPYAISITHGSRYTLKITMTSGTNQQYMETPAIGRLDAGA